MENFQKPLYDKGLKLPVSQEMISEMNKRAAAMGCGVSAYIRFLILQNIQATKVEDWVGSRRIG
jgi:hypothetical protein